MKKFATEIKWACIFTVAGLLWMFLEKMLGWHDTHIGKHAIYTNFFALIAITLFVLALREKRDKDLGGKMTWTQGIVSGVIISAFVAILAPLSQYIAYEFISPNYFTNAIDYHVKNGTMEQDNAQTLFNLKSYIIQAVFSALGIGVFTAAAVAFFVKKK